jgi:hypothetical protein
MQNKNNSFPDLEKLLQNLRQGLKTFDSGDILDMFQGRHDQEFVKKVGKKRWNLLESSVVEIADKCRNLDHPPDRLCIKFWLWRTIGHAVRKNEKPKWDAERIGNTCVAGIEDEGLNILSCIPLVGSFAPNRKSPTMHALAEGIWLLEPAIKPPHLFRMLQELLEHIPSNIRGEITNIGNETGSELGALLCAPIIACHTSSSFHEREHFLRKYGIPLISSKRSVKCILLLWPSICEDGGGGARWRSGRSIGGRCCLNASEAG